MIYNLESQSENLFIFILASTCVNFVCLPLFFLLQLLNFYFPSFVLIFYLNFFVYFLIYFKIPFQLKLLIWLRNSFFIEYFKFASNVICFSSRVSFFIFLCFFWLFSFYSKVHFVFFLAFLFLKILLYFFLIPKYLYFSLFYSALFRDYLKHIENNYKQNLDIQFLLKKLKIFCRL